MGKFGSSTRLTYESIVHLTATPVTVELRYGSQRYQNLGTHTLQDFLYAEADPSQPRPPDVKQVVFGRGEQVTYYLRYSISPIEWEYRFALNEINCLRQISTSAFYTPTDELYAMVEFNHSPHAIDPGPRNRYKLGCFQSHDTGPIHTTHNLNFSTYTNFTITFFARAGRFGKEMQLCTFRFVPLNEVLRNRVMDVLPGQPEPAPISGPTEGLMFLQNFVSAGESEGAEAQEVLLSQDSKPVAAKRIMVTSPNGSGAYEFVFTLRKESKRGAPHLQHQAAYDSPDILDFLSERDVYPDDPASFGDTEDAHFTPQKDCTFTSRRFRDTTSDNQVEVLIDGQETFARYYEVIMSAQHSVKILAWELSLSFGLVLASDTSARLPGVLDPSARWITLEDVLLDRASHGVKVRIVVWRHAVLSHLNRLIYLGEFSIEYEMLKLQRRCRELGISIRVFHTIKSMPEVDSPYADPDKDNAADIVVIIVSSPKGLVVASHHEKLLLIDSECPFHTYAFVGGFDIARGRYDKPLHQLPKHLFAAPSHLPQWASQSGLVSPPSEQQHEHYSGREVQPFWRNIRFLWHDVQILLRGLSTQQLALHFKQRWVHCFTLNKKATSGQEHLVLGLERRQHCAKHDNPVKVDIKDPDSIPGSLFSNCDVRLVRVWKGVFDTNYMLNEYLKMIRDAKHFLYFEHQYPFQNFALTYQMCETLKKNPSLRVVIISPVRTDLPTGLVGELVDWSQDHIIRHLHAIKKAAPDRVEIYGLLRQDDSSPRVRQIYVHSKLSIMDDERMIIGSTNMDNISFFYSSELSVVVSDPRLIKETKMRLVKEHLGKFFRPEMRDDFRLVYDTFKHIATLNYKSLQVGARLNGRPVFLAPADYYEQLLQRVYYPNRVAKVLYTLGMNTEDLRYVATETGNMLASYMPSLPRRHSLPLTTFFKRSSKL